MAIAPTSTGFIEDSQGLYINKDPAAKKAYSIDWGPFLDGDIIDTMLWTVEDGLTVVNQAKTDTTTIIEVSGGEPGKAYVCTCHIKALTSELEDEFSFRVAIRDQ